MTDEEKILFNKLKENKNGYIRLNFVQVDFLVNLIQKQEKVIDKLSWELSKNFCPDIDTAIIDCKTIGCNKCIKQYFYRKVDNNEN